jgi:hypothetical protein
VANCLDCKFSETNGYASNDKCIDCLRGCNFCTFEEVEGRKDDGNKLRYDLVPPESLEALVEVLTYGARKYAPGNWKHVQDFDNRYYAAAMRHLQAWRQGELVDSESGLEHLAHTMACITFLIAGGKHEA